MKRLILVALVVLLHSAGISGQCDTGTALGPVGKTLLKKSFRVSHPLEEMILSIRARAANTSWEKKEAEAAVLTVFVDGKYNQDVILFAGAREFQYRILLGIMRRGNHLLSIAKNHARSSPGAGQIKFAEARISPFSGSAIDTAAIANAPLLYLRPDTIDKFSDIPVLIYYEVFPGDGARTRIVYTIIFTNEDGGTQAAALMARWGRLTDIEWVYDIELKGDSIVSSTIQAAGHLIKPFSGQRIFGSHPVIYDATDNNNFSDTGCSELRTMLVPVRADLTARSRESMMDMNPWIYDLMAKEAIREARISPANLGGNTIADLRDYIYAEIYSEPEGALFAVETKTGDGKIVSSDDGNIFWRVERKGFTRIALRLPWLERKEFPGSLSIACYPLLNTSGVCRNTVVLRALRLDENYVPDAIKISPKPQDLKAGEKATFWLR